MIEIRPDICCGNGMLSDIAAIVTIMSLGITPIFFFVKRWYDKSSERKMVSQNLYGELNNALDALDYKTHPDNFFTIILPSDQEIQYMGRLFNHDVYDSLIYSGKINFLRHNLQQQIQDIFQHINDHNKYLTKVGEIPVRDKTNTHVYDYYERLWNIEVILLRTMPSTMKKLENDMKIN